MSETDVSTDPIPIRRVRTSRIEGTLDMRYSPRPLIMGDDDTNYREEEGHE